MGDWRTDILQAEQRKSFQEAGEGKRGKHQIMLDFVSQVENLVFNNMGSSRRFYVEE